MVSTAMAQKDSAFTLVRTYLGDVAGAAIDHMDNLYIISSKGQIRKLDAKGDSVAVYNQVRLSGQLHTIDVSNPLKILLFYKDFSTVVVLDRFLAPVATLDLRRYNILQPGAIGLSYDNNIWVFDQWDNKLKRIDEQGTKLMETPDLRSVFPQGLNPQRILSDNGLVYLADSAAGIGAVCEPCRAGHLVRSFGRGSVKTCRLDGRQANDRDPHARYGRRGDRGWTSSSRKGLRNRKCGNAIPCNYKNRI